MENKILVYKEEVEYNRYITKFKALKKHIEALTDGLNKMGIEPSIDIIKKFVRGDEGYDMVSKKQVQNIFNGLPIAMQKAISKMFQDQNKEEYNDLIGKNVVLIKNLINNPDSMVTYKALNFFNIENGVVNLLPEYIDQAEEWFCIYVDSPEH